MYGEALIRSSMFLCYLEQSRTLLVFQQHLSTIIRLRPGGASILHHDETFMLWNTVLF